MTQIYLNSTIYVLVFALVGWFASRLTGDASVADVFWGLGFVGLAWLSKIVAGGSALIPILITLWGIRLAFHIGIRNRKNHQQKRPDFRYENMRLQNPKIWWWWSFFKVFLLQACLMWIIGLAVIEGSSANFIATNIPLFVLGIALSLFGFIYEATADFQLTKFKSRFKRGNEEREGGAVLDTGLWGFSRHPNYFGETVFWWGIYFSTVSLTQSYWTIVSPLLISFLLLKVSGVTMLEKGLLERKAAYAEYIKNTPAFFPRFWN